MPNRTETNERGFSLLEVMVSIGVMMLLAEAVAVAYVNMMGQSKRSKVHSTLDDQLKYLGNYFTYRLQGVGGGAVRPWAAVWVEDNCGARSVFPGCVGSDRITTATSDPVLSECAIVGTAGPSTLQIDASAGCCLTAAFGSRQAVLSNGDFFSQQYLTNVQTGPCTVDVAPGVAIGGINSPPGAFNGWIGGRLTVVDVGTIYLDMATNELREFKDLNFNGVIDPGEESVLANQVYDLQFALGYDANPRDGRITNNGDDTDEWLYNSNGVNEGFGIGGLTGAVPSDLRMIEVGLLMGDQQPGLGTGPIAVLNGPARMIPGYQMSKSYVRFRFRNVGIFLPNG
jgi:Tfp pilus assembly protein PilE